ncbi:MAG: ABC transporter ATP-binding protein [Lachnospiraceae bacterium]|nr:ABC transporter ATP-binding protein [Lachnospiraceae bacterium]
MLSVKNISYNYSKKGFGIKDINIDLADGYFTTLLGKNGAGKTTLLKLMYKMLLPKSGEIIWNGEEIGPKNLCDFKKDVAYVDDSGWCRESLTLNENVDLFSGMYEQFDTKEFEDYLNKFELDCNLDEKHFSELSKGEQMKYLIAFALARKPKFLIMDEPFTNLDPIVKTDLIEAIHQKVMNDNMGVIMSTHLVEDVSNITDYVVIMEEGKVKLFGDRDTVMTDKSVMSFRELMVSEVWKNCLKEKRRRG